MSFRLKPPEHFNVEAKTDCVNYICGGGGYTKIETRIENIVFCILMRSSLHVLLH